MESNIGKNLMSYFNSDNKQEQKPAVEQEAPAESAPLIETQIGVNDNAAKEVETKVETSKKTEEQADEAVAETAEALETPSETAETPIAETEQKKESTPESKPTTEEVETTPQEPSLDNEAVLKYLRETSGKEITSIEDLLKEPEPTTDPLADLPEETQQFIKYNKETGRSYEEFKKLNTDYTKFTALQLAQMKAIEFSEGALTASDVNEYLEKELNIDLDHPSELDKFDMIKLKGYGKDFLQRQITDQDKYKQPIPKTNSDVGPKMVALEGGVQMSEEAYNTQVAQQKAYQDGIKSSVDSITNTSFQVKIDDQGQEKIINLAYDYSKEDRHNMLSNAADLTSTVTKYFGDKDGNIDYKSFQEAVWRLDPANMGKMVSHLVQKARADWTEEMTKESLNANFDPNKKIPNKDKNISVEIPGQKSNFGVKYPLEQFKM